jgi:hypothetical protein
LTWSVTGDISAITFMLFLIIIHVIVICDKNTTRIPTGEIIGDSAFHFFFRWLQMDNIL